MAHIGKDSEGFYYNYPNGYMGASTEEAKSNAVLLANMLLECGWSLYGIAGFFSAVNYESQFDPRCIEGMKSEEYLRKNPYSAVGAGLIQWTNGYNQLIKYCDEWGIDWKLASSQVRKLELERTSKDSNIIQYFSTIKTYRKLWDENNQNPPPATMTQYVTATAEKWSYLEMAMAWILFYTRPASYADKNKWQRNAENMKKWYEFLKEHFDIKPTFTKWKTYRTLVNLNVRTGAGTNFNRKTYYQLTLDAQKHADKKGVLKAGTEVTCIMTKELENGEIWMQIPSGWVCAYQNKERYIG